MKKNEKIIIGILIVFTIIVTIVAIKKKTSRVSEEEGNKNQVEITDSLNDENAIGEFVQVESDGTKLNKSEELNKDKKLGDLSFKNIQLTNKDGKTVLLANVTNTGTSKTTLKKVSIIVLDKNQKELGKVAGVIIPLEPGKSTQFNSTTQTNYVNAYDFKIVED